MGLYIAISNSIGASSISGGAKKTFEFTINTANLSTGSTANNQFKLPLTTSTGLNCKVSWGDGTTSDITSHTAPAVTHTYPSIGTYTIKITGSLLGWQFNNGGDRLKMLNVSQWSGLNISTNRGFFGCTNLTATATDAPLITSALLDRTFQDCSNFNGEIGNWDISNVTNIEDMFNGAIVFNKYIGNWNTSKINAARSLFSNASAFNQDISTKIINAGQPNEYVAWDVSKVSVMTNVFSGASAFNKDIGSWDVSNVTLMHNMFSGATAFNNGNSGSIGSWDTSKVTSMQAFSIGMFQGARAFNQNIGAWDVSKVVDFTNMFSNATAFNNGGSDDIDNWTFSTTSNINMSGMFGGSNTTNSCKFNRYIGSWDTQRVTDMSFMFFLNTAFNQNIGAWNVANVTNMAGMFRNASAFNQNIGAWNVSKVTAFDSMFRDASNFRNGSSDDINNWTLSTISNITMGGMFRSTPFNRNIGSWNTQRVTDMGSMFIFNSAFNQNIGSWNTSAVTNMAEMFREATAFNQDISNWNVSNVANFTSFMLDKSPANYLAQYLSNIYEKWSLLTLVPNLNINFGSIKYNTSGAIGKNRLLNAPKNYIITDGGQEAPFAFSVKTDNAGVSTSTQFRMPLTTSTNLGFTVNWGDGVTETITDHTLAIHTYATAGTYNVSVTGAILGWQFAGGGDG
jgi:surface protein